MYILDDYIVKVSHIVHDNLELFTVTVHNGCCKVCISLFYRPPSSPPEVFDNLCTFLEVLDITQFSNFILLGDFNVNFVNTLHPSFSRLSNIINTFCLSQVVTDHTHVSPNGHTSLIDLVLMSSPSLLQSCSTIPPLSNSDHLGLQVKTYWRTSAQTTRSFQRTVWNYSNADWSRACDLIDSTDWNSLVTDDVNTSWHEWQHRFLEIMNMCVPKQTLPRRHNLPWLNKHLLQSMRRRNHLYKRAKKSGNHVKYKRVRNKVISQLRKAKATFFRNLNPRNPKKFWKAVKYLNKHHSAIPTLSHGDTVAQSGADKAEMLNSFFVSCFNSSQPPLTHADSNTLKPDHACPENILCKEQQVLGLLRAVDTSKANGPDEISARMLKHTARSIAPSVTKLFNLSLCSGQLPVAWKQSLIVPVPKSPVATTPNNYRPISLLSILSKLLERHIYSLVATHLELYHPLSNAQWGFQTGKSTTTALLSTTHEWLTALEQRKEVSAVFFDLKKAFDSVPHKELMSKLQQLSLDSHVLHWISNYLTCRCQKVVVSGETSRDSPVLSGVPQGSVLGPLLFLIYINSLANVSISDGTRMVMYADDLLLFRPIAKQCDFHTLQRDIDTVAEWVSANYLTFNHAKCKCMLVSRKSQSSTPPTLTLNGCDIEQVQHFKYLGLLLSSDMSWSPHIESTCSKAKRILGLLYRRFYGNTDSTTLVQLYQSLVRPHMEYASEVWDPHTQKNRNKLEDIQKFACKIATRRWDLGYQELLELTGIPSLATRRLHLKLCTLYKIVYNLCSFPSGILVPRANYSQRTSHPLQFHQPHAYTNSFQYSFVPHAISMWNSLPWSTVSAQSLFLFKSKLVL